MPTDAELNEELHIQRINEYGAKVKEAYNEAIYSCVKIGIVANFDPEKPFTFSGIGKEKEITKIIEKLNYSIETIITDGTYQEWLQSSLNNDKIVDTVFKGSGIKKVKIGQFYQRNLEALDSFQKRKVDGFDISERVWRTTEPFKKQMEMSIDVGLIEGKSAAEMSRDVRGYLNEPDKLFRRVRDERGNLHLSQNAQNYHPGQGQYRSSYKNSYRLTRTETNMSYRTSDLTRWNQTPFILGYEVKKSKRHIIEDICDELAGKYPIGFKFTGWHPQCFCFMTPIMAGEKEFLKYQQAILNDEDVSNYQFSDKIEKLPVNFIGWTKDNHVKMAKSKGTPYFIRDNLDKKNILQSALVF